MITTAPITITNSGDIWATSTAGRAGGIFAQTDGDDSLITITNSGDIWATSAGGPAYGIYTETFGESDTIINNSGDITVAATSAWGIKAQARYGSSITINNSGDITATARNGYTIGIYGLIRARYPKHRQQRRYHGDKSGSNNSAIGINA